MRIKSTVLLYLALILMVSGSALAQIQAPAIEWQRTIGGNLTDRLWTLKQTWDGGYILGGDSNSSLSGDKTDTCRGGADFWIVKLDSTGVIQWQRTIGGTGDDWPWAVRQTLDSGYIIGGWSVSGIGGEKTHNGYGPGYDYWVVKVDYNGSIQWQRTIGGNADDLLSTLEPTADGGYILGGSSESNISGDKNQNSYGMADFWIVKLDSSGATQWQKTIGGDQEDHILSVKQTAGGGYILGGDSFSGISGVKTSSGRGGRDYWVVKIDSVGTIEWQRALGGNAADLLWPVSLAADGGFLIGGTSFSNVSGDKTMSSHGSSDYWVVKLNSGGAIQWQKTIGGSQGDNLQSMDGTPDGGYILGGSSLSDISGDKTQNSKGSMDYWVVRLDSIGAIQWEKTIGGSGYDHSTSLEITADGGCILGGTSTSSISGDKTENSQGSMDYWIIKLAPDGLATSLLPSLKSSDNLSLNTFPNPVTERTRLVARDMPAGTQLSINVLDINGKTLLRSQGTLSAINDRLGSTLMSFAKGVYFIQVSTPEGIGTVKVVR